MFDKPPGLSIDDWFAALAEHLLHGARLIVGGEPHRLVEIEFYLFNHEHPDPFTYRHPLQREPGRWFFHRAGNSYCNGSFKGLDLTIRAGDGFGGILIRSLETSAGSFVIGPSLCVDHLLAKTGFKTVAELDAAIQGRAATAAGSPVRLQAVPADGPHKPIYRSARIGLSLKKSDRLPEGPRFIVRPYRFLTEPRRVSKGKLHLVLALHRRRLSPQRIGQITGCPRRTIEHYIDDYELGREQGDFTAFIGADLGPRQLCRLHGAATSRRRAGHFHVRSSQG